MFNDHNVYIKNHFNLIVINGNEWHDDYDLFFICTKVRMILIFIIHVWKRILSYVIASFCSFSFITRTLLVIVINHLISMVRLIVLILLILGIYAQCLLTSLKALTSQLFIDLDDLQLMTISLKEKIYKRWLKD